MTRRRSAMIAVFALGAALLVFGYVGSERPEGAPRLRARIEIPARLDLGRVSDLTEVVSVGLPMHNRGERPISIRVNSISCGCLLVTERQFVLGRGQHRAIELKYHPRGRLGAQRFRVSVLGQDPRDADERIQSGSRLVWQSETTVHVEVVSSVSIEPTEVSLGPTEADGQRSLALRTVEGVNIESVQVRGLPPGLRFEERRLSNRQRTLTVRVLSGAFVPSGRLILPVHVYRNRGFVRRELRLRIQTPSMPLRIEGNHVHVGYVRSGFRPIRVLVRHSLGTLDREDIEVSLAASPFRARVQEVQAGAFTLLVELQDALGQRGPVDETIDVRIPGRGIEQSVPLVAYLDGGD